MARDENVRFRLSRAEFAQLRRLAKAHNVSRSELLRLLLKWHIAALKAAA